MAPAGASRAQAALLFNPVPHVLESPVMRRAAILLFSFLLIAPQSFAADAWTSVRSKNFLLVGDASERDIRRIAETLEQFREAVGRLLPRRTAASPVGTTVVVFRNDASFRPFKPLYQGKPGNVAGFFQGGEEMNFIALTAGEDAPRVVFHEYVHLLTTDSVAYTPAWFREGIAEYYSTFEAVRPDRVRVGRRIGEHLLQLKENGLLPLHVLLAVDRDSPHYNEIDKQGAFYAQSWAFVHFLLAGDGGKWQPRLPVFLNLLAQGRSIEDAVQDAFQMSTAALERRVEQYIYAASSWPTTEYTFTDRLVFEKEMTTETLSEAEVQFYLGDLLLHCGRLEEAEAHLRKALELNSKLAPAQAAMGMLRVRQQREAEALPYLKQAAESGSASYLVHYYYAQVLKQQAGKTSDADILLTTMQRELKRALDLAPHFAPAVETLAYVNLMRREELNETVALLRNVLKASPGRESAMMMLAQVLIQLRERDEATAILQRIAASTTVEPAIKQHARSLLASIGLSEILPPKPLNEPARTSNIEPVSPPPASPSTSSPSDDAGRSGRNALQRIDPVPPPVEGETVTGVLTEVDCSKGLTLSVNTGAAVVKLHTPAPSKIEFVSFTKAVTGTLSCGALRSGGVPVRVTYRPGPSQGILGEPLVVAFIEKN